jgi:hypothetical protein
MNASLVLVSGLAVTLAAALTVVRYLHEPLRKQLQELCGNAERAEFWTAFSSVTVVLTPSILMLGWILGRFIPRVPTPSVAFVNAQKPVTGQ